MTDAPTGVVVYLRDHRRTEPEPASVDDAFALWWASFRMMWLASFEVAEAMQRETFCIRTGPVDRQHALPVH